MTDYHLCGFTLAEATRYVLFNPKTGEYIGARLGGWRAAPGVRSRGDFDKARIWTRPTDAMAVLAGRYQKEGFELTPVSIGHLHPVELPAAEACDKTGDKPVSGDMVGVAE